MTFGEESRGCRGNKHVGRRPAAGLVAQRRRPMGFRLPLPLCDTNLGVCASVDNAGKDADSDG